MRIPLASGTIAFLSSMDSKHSAARAESTVGGIMGQGSRAAGSILGIIFGLFVQSVTVRAMTVQVRDAVGGESATGEPGWYFLTGTGSISSGTISNGSFGALRGGTYAFDVDFGAGWESLLTYCLEPDAEIGFGMNSGEAVGLPYELTTLDQFAGLTSADENYLEILWANAFADSQTSREKAAAFQMIVWEVVRDGDFDLGVGSFRLNGGDVFTAGVLSQAQQWINNIDGGQWTSRTDLHLLTNPDSQDYLTPVPEPATLSLIALGALVSMRRRRR